MQINLRSFPHPVLSPFSDDILDSAFQCAVRAFQEGHEYKFEVLAKVSNEQLANLVDEGDAKYAVHVECPATRYRNLWKFSESNGNVFRIPVDALEGRVQVCAFILAEKDIPQYTNSGFHSDYEGMAFGVRRGDILAVDENKMFVIERQDTFCQIPSIFTITANLSSDPPAIDVEIMGHKIVIKLSTENYDRYLQLRQDANLRPLLNASIVLPALVYVLDLVNPERCSQEELGMREDQKWYRVLRRKLEERGVRLDSEQGFRGESAVNLASRLIGNPLSAGIESIMSLIENED